MGNSPPTSVHVVYSQIIGLAEHPFPSAGLLRPAWNDLFNNEKCLFKSSHLIRTKVDSKRRTVREKKSWKSFKWKPDYPDYTISKPFIRNLGVICFNRRNAMLNSRGNVTDPMVTPIYSLMALDPSLKLPTGRWKEEYAERFGIDEYAYEFIQARDGTRGHNIFGHDHTLEDQRMNALCFEVVKPLLLRASTREDIKAEGKVFIHIYPSGYVALLLAVAVNWRQQRSDGDLHSILRETRPWRKDSKWTWKCRIFEGGLGGLVEEVKKCLQLSFYRDFAKRLVEGEWRSATKIVSDDDPELIAATFFLTKDNYEEMDLQSHPSYRTSLNYLFVSRQGLLCIARPGIGRHKSRRFFWKILVLFEFVALKQRIYDDYIELFRREIIQLKEFRLSLKRKVTKEDVLRFSVYDYKIPRFLSALDKHIRTAAPFHRRLYSTLSLGTGFNDRRGKALELIRTWEEEIAQWEHGVVVLWKRIVSPLRSLLS